MHFSFLYNCDISKFKCFQQCWWLKSREQMVIICILMACGVLKKG